MDKTLRDIVARWRSENLVKALEMQVFTYLLDTYANELEAWAKAKAQEWRKRDEPLTLQESADELWPDNSI